MLLRMFVLFILASAAFPAAAQTPNAILGEAPVAHRPIGPSGKRLPAREAGPERYAGGWIDTANRSAVRDAYLNEFVPVLSTPPGWTGNAALCDAGDTTAAFKNAVLANLNWFRRMAGVPPLTGLNSVYNAKDQKAALMFSVNKNLSHTPPSTWTCYSADGAEAAGNSNICLSSYNPNDPGCVALFIDDPGANNFAAGHRRWILYPQTQQMGTGDVPAHLTFWRGNALWVFDGNTWGPRPATRQPYVAWPPPGYVPKQTIYERWSFSYPAADFGAAVITMTRGGSQISTSKETVATGYGENTVVWKVPSAFLTEVAGLTSDLPVEVTVSNVVINGSAQAFQYTVTIIDPSQEGASAVSVTVNTSPPGLNVTVDGVTAQAPRTFQWVPGSSHTLDAPSPQGSSVTRYNWASWSQGGNRFQTITTPGAAVSYTANFQTEHRLTTSVNPAAGGSLTVTPVSADGFYNAGTEVSVAAQANAGYQFSGFSGDLTGVASPQALTMHAPRSVTANFSSAAVAITVTSQPAGLNVLVDGAAVLTPATFQWIPASTHTLEAPSAQPGTSGTRYAYQSWSNQGARVQTIVTPQSATSYVAAYQTQYLLTRAAVPANGGTLAANPPSADGYYAAGAQVQLTASAAAGFQFSGFQGALTGTANPQNLLLQGPAAVTANFSSAAAVITTIASQPAGITVLVDGANFTTPAAFSWTPASTHTIEVPVSVTNGGTRHVFANWSQGGARAQTLTAPSTTTQYVAFYDVHYLLTAQVNPPGAGSVLLTPAVPDGFYPANTSVLVSASPGAGFMFSGFTGALAGPSNPQSLTMTAPQSVTAHFAGSSQPPVPIGGQPLRFVAVTPCRVADTRYGEGKSGALGPPALAPRETRTMPISAGSCGIPTSAAAYSLNVTVVPAGALGYLTIWPAGVAQPLASTLNSFDGRVVANAAIVPAGAHGAVSVFVTDRTDVIVDINGYFVP